MRVDADTATLFAILSSAITYCLVKVISQIQKSRCVSCKTGCLEVKRDVPLAAVTTPLCLQKAWLGLSTVSNQHRLPIGRLGLIR